ncbi:MAG: TraR/DksA family transcriptional regulator [Planctomycetes bacterium]|nr:TraR/DksA family transcriptional regulator [Planctomycetota bacterium]
MSKKLNARDLETYRGLLTQLRRELSGDITSLEADAFSTDGDRLSVDNPADIGSESFAQEFSLELLQRDEATLTEIDEALGRVVAGTYGLCEGCAEPIPKVRLNAVPHARFCVECQRKTERRR